MSKNYFLIRNKKGYKDHSDERYRLEHYIIPFTTFSESYGYLSLSKATQYEAMKVKQFIEKPDSVTAHSVATLFLYCLLSIVYCLHHRWCVTSV